MRCPPALVVLGVLALAIPAVAAGEDRAVQRALVTNAGASGKLVVAARNRAVRCARADDVPCVRGRGRVILVHTARSLRRLNRSKARAARSPGLRRAASLQRAALVRLASAGRHLRRGRANTTVRRRLNTGVRDVARAGRIARAWRPSGGRGRDPVDPAPPGPPAAQIASPPTPAPTVTTFTLTMDGMSPAWTPAVSDYGVRCPGGVTTFRVEAPEGHGVRLGDGRTVGPGRTSLPIVLVPGRSVDVQVTTPAGASAHTARCLPEDFPAYSATRAGETQAEWYLVTFGGLPYTAIFDPDGAPVWWMRSAGTTYDGKLLADGTLAWAVAPGGGEQTRFEIRTLDGTLVRSLRTVGVSTDFHDLQVTPEGTYLLMSYARREHVDLTAVGGGPDATVLDAELQEVTADNDLLWRWSSADHIDPSETGRWLPAVVGNDPVDLVHINSVEPDGASLVISARHTDAVYRIDRATGEVEWKLGGTPTPQSLTVVGDGLAPAILGGQHDARVLPDGTLTVSDNGTLLGRAPRAVRYAIDLDARTATLVEEIRDAGITRSDCCGSARRLAGGNWVVGWGLNSTVTENAPDGTRVLALDFAPPVFSYRTFPVEPGALSRVQLRAGMDAMAAAGPSPAPARTTVVG